MARRVTVRVPATSANLGPGFDCLALALDLWNEAVFTLEGDRLSLSIDDDCAVERGSPLPQNDDNLIVRAMRAFCQQRGISLPAGLSIRCRNHIPTGSGMGSSAAAVLLGLLGAAALCHESLSPEEALPLAAHLEGHADNAAAALLGGLVMIAAQDHSWLTRRVDLPDLPVVVVLPEFNLPTHAARAALPAQFPLKTPPLTWAGPCWSSRRCVLVILICSAR